jgi:hypothetical protein
MQKEIFKSWDNKTGTYVDTPEKQISFLKEIEDVCKKYGLSISHEDQFGAFRIDTFDPSNIEWLKKANINWL